MKKLSLRRSRRLGQWALPLLIGSLIVSNMYFAATASRARAENETTVKSFGIARERLNDLERSLNQLYAMSDAIGQMTRGNVQGVQAHVESGLTGKTTMMPALAKSGEDWPSGTAIGGDSVATTAAQTRNQPPLQTESYDSQDSTQRVFDRLFLLRERADGMTRRIRGLLTMVRIKRDYFSGVPTIQPADGHISSHFGVRLSPFDGRRVMHAGIDVAAEVGTSVHATADGVVTFAGNFEDLGRTVVISHGFGIQTRYGHNDKIQVAAGTKVKRGQAISTVGMTGNTTGPHVHYEVWVNDQAVDPMDFILDSVPLEYQGIVSVANVPVRGAKGGVDTSVLHPSL